MDSRQMLDIQSERGSKSEASEANTKTLDYAISECRREIRDRAAMYAKLSGTQRRDEIKRLIVSHVMGIKYSVENFIMPDGKNDTNKLVDKLVEEITDYGILTNAIIDESIYEIRANGREIKIEREGRCQDLIDNVTNEVVRFSSVQQQEIIIRRLLGDVKLTPKDAAVNASTTEGYRMAAVHSSALGDDPQDVANMANNQYHSFVLRKFKNKKMELAEIVKGKALSDNMARMVETVIKGNCSFFCAGPTASGKTTLLQAALRSFPNEKRIIVIQNPSEIDLRKKDRTGRVVNDVVHWEARAIDNSTDSDPTMENLMMHALRSSPTAICVGEIRTNKEIELGVTIMGAGHPLYISTHAANAKGLYMRILRGFMASSGETMDTAAPSVADLMDIAIVQLLMEDGRRRVLQISEIEGVSEDNIANVKINDIYRFKVERTIRDSSGKVIDIIGKHKRVGKISDILIDKLVQHGINLEEIEFITKDPDNSEIETYIGDGSDGKEE